MYVFLRCSKFYMKMSIWIPRSKRNALFEAMLIRTKAECLTIDCDPQPQIKKNSKRTYLLPINIYIQLY